MKYWTKDELHEIEEILLDRKAVIKYLPSSDLSKIRWAYEEWEDVLLEQCAKFEYPISAIEKFLHRQTGDLLHHLRESGYKNWAAFCEATQDEQRTTCKKPKSASYREIMEAAIGRPLTKDEQVHHINCIHSDDELNNLWLCDRANHRHAHASYRKLQKALIANGVIAFNRNTGDYEFNVEAVEGFEKSWNAQNPSELQD